MSVRNALLSLLADGPEYGFALKKRFEERTGELWPLNVGQVYTTLGRLMRDGLVDEVVPGAEKGPASDGPGPAGAARRGDAEAQREYRLTPAGRDELRSWMVTPRPRDVPDRDELVIKIALAEELDRHGQLDGVGLFDIIDAQRAVSTTALQRFTREKAALDPSDLGRVLTLDAVTLQIEAELRWLDLCEARLAQVSRGRRTDSPRENP